MTILGELKSLASLKFLKKRKKLRESIYSLAELRDLILAHQTLHIQQSHPNPLNKFGKKTFSQTDEDGITVEILRRIGILDKGTFAEFGVGDGTENNTLILKALGWKGFWVGGESLAYEIKPQQNFSYINAWITLSNIIELTIRGKSQIDSNTIDVISLDLDGNDIYFVEKLLSNRFHPKLFIVEYNAKFIPPIKWQIDYDENHFWKKDDYLGASLQSFIEVFNTYGYRLVCCNAHSGSNAFFVQEEYESAFHDIPSDANLLFVAPRYYAYKNYGHPSSIKTISKLFE